MPSLRYSPTSHTTLLKSVQCLFIVNFSLIALYVVNFAMWSQGVQADIQAGIWGHTGAFDDLSSLTHLKGEMNLLQTGSPDLAITTISLG